MTVCGRLQLRWQCEARCYERYVTVHIALRRAVLICLRSTQLSDWRFSDQDILRCQSAARHLETSNEGPKIDAVLRAAAFEFSCLGIDFDLVANFHEC